MGNVTALGAGDFSNSKTQYIIFISEEHKKFYSMMLEKSKNEVSKELVKGGIRC